MSHSGLVLLIRLHLTYLIIYIFLKIIFINLYSDPSATILLSIMFILLNLVFPTWSVITSLYLFFRMLLRSTILSFLLCVEFHIPFLKTFFSIYVELVLHCHPSKLAILKIIIHHQLWNLSNPIQLLVYLLALIILI